ncbi:hypothetical protein ACHHYP_05794 [Achlya hypogyna]|uniref:Uncharacterized protein n=1 Tax=Achlya hypogyna TaxID=1202772 RepID=A0A1V9YWI2_ACHHY|nr:hypothetical protein ACHHYP_05794 [Achlya hypogyna]
MLTTHRRKSVIVQQMSDIVQAHAQADTEPDDDVHWWEARVRVVQDWLRANPLHIGLPEDGTIETITQQIARGDKFVHVRVKAWNHIVAELQGIPGVCEKFATVETSPELPPQPEAPPGLDDDTDHNEDPASTPGSAESMEAEPPMYPISPFRGKLHPAKAKSLHDSSTMDVSNQDPVPHDKPEPRKSIAQMSMMERQEEWLRKKAEKAAAEKARQLEEAEKELTFQPSLVKKPSTKPVDDGGQSPRKLQRSKSAGRTRKPLNKDKSAAGLKPKATSSRSLLDSVKADLAASVQKKTDAPMPKPHRPDELPPTATADATIAYVAAALENINKTTLAPPPSVAPAVPSTERPFHFDAGSTDAKARFQLQDPALFDLTSIYRKKDKYARAEGVSLQMGRRDDTHEEQLIAVMFDRDKFPSEDIARAWYDDHKVRLHSYM